MMQKRFEKKTVLITGASSGIGLAAAEAFAAEGADVILYARRGERLSAACEAIGARGGSAEYLTGDVADAAGIKAACDLAVDRYGRLDIFINNAGVGDGHAAAIR